MRKIRPNHRFTFLTFFILFIALEFLLWAIFGSKPWINKYVAWYIELTYSLVAVVVSFVPLIIYIYKVYYLIDDKAIYRHGKNMSEYKFNEIVYLDEEYAKRHIDAYIYLSRGIWILLTMDRKKEILKLIKEKSPLLDKENFIYKYPNAFNQLKK